MKTYFPCSFPSGPRATSSADRRPQASGLTSDPDLRGSSAFLKSEARGQRSSPGDFEWLVEPPNTNLGWLTVAKSAWSSGPTTTSKTILQAVQQLAIYARAYSHDATVASANPAITGTYQGHPKCNVFVGDVLYIAGYAAPTHDISESRQRRGTHYRKAEDWPRDQRHFVRIDNLSSMQPGDLLVIDYPGKGPGKAHIEIITQCKQTTSGTWIIRTMGARTTGTIENGHYGKMLSRAAPRHDHFQDGVNTLYILRPKLRVSSTKSLTFSNLSVSAPGAPCA